MAAELLTLIIAVSTAAIIFAWRKWGKALFSKAPSNIQDIIKDNVKELEDGELTEEEVKERLEDLLD